MGPPGSDFRSQGVEVAGDGREAELVRVILGLLVAVLHAVLDLKVVSGGRREERRPLAVTLRLLGECGLRWKGEELGGRWVEFKGMGNEYKHLRINFHSLHKVYSLRFMAKICFSKNSRAAKNRRLWFWCSDLKQLLLKAYILTRF